MGICRSAADFLALLKVIQRLNIKVLLLSLKNFRRSRQITLTTPFPLPGLMVERFAPVKIRSEFSSRKATVGEQSSLGYGSLCFQNLNFAELPML